MLFCGDLTILLLGLAFHCFVIENRKSLCHSLGRPLRSDFVQLEFAVIYADDGISGTNTKKREDFNRMIDDCEAGNIDMIITKSISRFARNTLDCLKYIRELKDMNIPVIFEKESIAHTTQKS